MTLAICMVFGSAAALPQGMFSDSSIGITASADWQQEGDFKYDYLQDGTIEIKDYTGKSSTIRVPHAIGNKTVTSIGSYAFNCTKADSIVIPDRVKFIKEAAFKESTVKSISISRTVESIDTSAFQILSQHWRKMLSITATHFRRSISARALPLLEAQFPRILLAISQMSART